MTRLLSRWQPPSVLICTALAPGGGDAACVVVRLEVAFNDGHAKFGSQIRKRTLQQRRFARTGRAYEIQGKDAVFGELIFQACRQLSVGFKNITNDRYFHNKLLYSASICWTYSSRPVSIECPYCSPQAGHGAKKCSPLTAGKVCPHWEHLRVMGTSSVSSTAPSKSVPAVSASKAKERASGTMLESAPYRTRTSSRRWTSCFSISSRTMDNRLVTTDISCMAELLWLIPGTRLGSFWTEAQGRSVGEKEW